MESNEGQDLKEDQLEGAVDEAQVTEPEGGAPSPGRGISKKIRSLLRPRMGRKPLILAASLLVIVLGGLGAFKAMEWKKGGEARRAEVGRNQTLQDGLRQEELPRFYIPLPPNSRNRVMAVDFSVVWDALSAVRFQKMEVQVRDRLYAFLLGLTQRGDDFEDKVPQVETELGRILRESLRTENLVVKVREIKAF